MDYPILSSPGSSAFSCSDRVFGGYYADTEQGCQVFHICLQDSMVSMICPNGTVFAQVRLRAKTEDDVFSCRTSLCVTGGSTWTATQQQTTTQQCWEHSEA